MKTSLEIIQEFSYMFKYDDFPFECDTGWNELIYNCLKEMAKVDKEKFIDIVEIKEKYGWLRLYWHYNDFEVNGEIIEPPLKDSTKIYDKISKIVAKYEEKTLHTCEIDGEKGKLHHKGTWYKTLCKECAKEEGYVPVIRKIVKAKK
jgi:transcription initiation factor IIE alpha subunit